VAFENFLSDEQQSWRDTCNRFIDREITREYIRKCDMERTYYYEAYEKIAAQGWLGLMIPEDHGGIGGDAMDWVIFFEAMGKYSNDFSAATLGVSMYTAQALCILVGPTKSPNISMHTSRRKYAFVLRSQNLRLAPTLQLSGPVRRKTAKTILSPD
jgi:hypothetical protein